MTILDLAGPVLLRVLPTTVGVLLATAGAACLPVALPRFLVWLKGPVAPEHHSHVHQQPHADAAVEHEHTYSI